MPHFIKYPAFHRDDIKWKAFLFAWKFMPYTKYHFICDYLAGTICHVPTPTVLRKAETEGEKYIYFWQQKQLLLLLLAVRQTCWKRWLPVVVLVSWDQTCLLMTANVLKFGRKLLYGLCQEGMYKHSSSWEVEPRRNFGLEKCQDKFKNLPLLLPPFGRKLYCKRDYFSLTITWDFEIKHSR